MFKNKIEIKLSTFVLLSIFALPSNAWFGFGSSEEIPKEKTETIIKKENGQPYFVIMAGGKGERLWPLSREDKPKQFIPIRGKSCLLEETVDRVGTMANSNNIRIITNEKYKGNVEKVVANKVGDIFGEPAIRNTAPAIALSCLRIMEEDPEAVVIFLPADHYIHEKYLFLDGIERAIEFAKKEEGIVLFGITPTYPATGYGYIEFKQPCELNKPSKILRFREKPNLEKAKEFLGKSNFLWNAGVFCGKVKSFIKAFEKYDNEVLQDVKDFLAGKKEYKDVKSISVDYAIMEKSENTYVLPLSITWLDVGSIDAFLKLKNRASDPKENIITHNACDNLVEAKDKLVVLIGVNKLCIVDTGDVLLVAQKDESQAIKSVLNSLRESNKFDYL